MLISEMHGDVEAVKVGTEVRGEFYTGFTFTTAAASFLIPVVLTRQGRFLSISKREIKAVLINALSRRPHRGCKTS